MPQQVLFIHGGGAGAFEDDRRMVASLEAALGVAHEVRYPKIPRPDRPTNEAGTAQINAELAMVEGIVILISRARP